MIETKPITVLMPVYNGEKYIREAIDSILNQTFTDFEFLIVNDGSTDQTEQIINSYNDKRIKLVNKINGGVSCALNYGLKNASGKYIARFDADDICYPNRLEEQYNFMLANPDYVLIGSDADYVNQYGEFIFSYESTGHRDGEIKERIFERNPFIHSVVFFPKEMVVKEGGYDLKAHTFEDHLLWVKIIKKGKVCNFKKSFIKVRLNPESVTTDERVRGKRFLEIRKKILMSNGPISDQDEHELLKIIKSQNSDRIRKLGYHLFVAKKYLWNNYQPGLAREHLMASIKLKPFEMYAYILLCISFLPKSIIYKLYNSIK
jgi:glycosyltransferase involved in cell wall biosynthesis